MCIIKEAVGAVGMAAAAGRVHTDRIGRIQPTCEILVRPASDRLTEKYAFAKVVDPPTALPARMEDAPKKPSLSLLRCAGNGDTCGED